MEAGDAQLPPTLRRDDRQDTQKFLGVRISGRPVIGPCTAAGWRGRVEVFLGRELPPETPGNRSSGVLISWLR